MERWFVTGASGQLGGHVLHALRQDQRAKAIIAISRTAIVDSAVESRLVDLSNADGLTSEVEHFRPTHVLHIGAMTAVGDCHQQPERARLVNVEATAALASAACSRGARFVFVSTDMVFDGNSAPYRESDRPAPLSHYGRTKLAAEERLAGVFNCSVVRLPLLFGFPRTPRPATFASQIESLRAGQPLRLFADEFRTPLWLPDAAAALLLVARSDLAGILHVAGPQRLSRLEMLEQAASAMNIANPRLESISRLSIAAAEPRPADLSLDDSRFRSLFPNAPRTTIAAALAGRG